MGLRGLASCLALLCMLTIAPRSPSVAAPTVAAATVLSGRHDAPAVLPGTDARQSASPIASTPTSQAAAPPAGTPAPTGKAPAASAAPTGKAPAAPVKRPGLIMLLTDFGQRGYLLGNLKGSIYRAFPEARIDSISNDIPKFDIDEAAQTLVLSTADYPAGTIFVVVVDPGTGAPRTPVVLETENGHIYLAPDNGVLTQVAIRYRPRRIHRIENRDIILADPAASTYLSRDVFGPAAGALARGLDIAELGPQMKNMYLLTTSPAQVRENQVFGTVRLIDGFGNVHTNIKREQAEKVGLKEGDQIEVAIGERHFKAKWVRTYGDVKAGETLARVGNNEEIQLSINQDNLARRMEIQKGESVVLRRP